MNKPFLLYNCAIISPGFFIKNGEILVAEGKITAVGKSGEVSKSLDKESSDLQKYDLEQRLLLPGFVNPHAHLYSSLSAGLSSKGTTESFIDVLENFWWPLDAALDEETAYYSALSGIIDAVKHGVTCIVDHHASMNYVRGSLKTLEKAFRMAGIKGVLCFETSDRESNAAVDEHIEENFSFFESHKTDHQIRGMLGLHANFTLGSVTLEKISDAKISLKGNLPVHIHCGESEYDFDYCKNEGFEGPVDRLERYSLIDSDSILAHCIHISKRDIEILNSIKPVIVTNPESNANNRVGKPDREKFHRYLTGTDGMSFDMIASLRSQYLLGSGLSEDFSSLYDSSIAAPYELAESIFKTTGKIEAGYDADIAVLDYAPETPLKADNIMGHLLFGARGGKVFMTVAGGNILYHEGRLTFTFESSIKNQIRSAAEKLHRRYYG